ncbi:nuclear localization protein [Lindgomyces ingoldianus]|uniref:Nuclear localization protein n=1 Tax=Lindgomyces ingoldianus TaxID=673940 RepID=A0ACB6R1U7_9PLEO|nr:nuclear localization protein [Lindgomyces ingoldianus]KAF2473234.1 nuclear localization protein [Lindgomyces ingoldianus]
MARGRPSRAAARRSTPVRSAALQQDSDDEMVDAPDSRAETPPHEEDAETPVQESDGEKAPSEPSSPPVVQPFPRKKRLGRPPKNRPPDWNVIEPDNASEGGTPVKRKRGRPAGGGGFRGRARGGPSHTTRVPIDKEGNMMDVVNDEVDLPEDSEGEQKVDKLGNLKGGRDYRVRVFKITGRGDRLYMLSTEPARCTGFRDSYLFFTKHMQLYKIIIDDSERRDLIDRDIIPHSYKGRAIGVVTARSVFREFGARIIIGGKRIIDDYYVTAAKERGDIEGEIVDPNDKLPPLGEPYNKNQYVAWHGASSVYHTGVPSVPTANGKPVPGKRKVNITSANWQFEHGRAASRFNSSLSALRKANMAGVYEPHTNLMCYPKITQPTHARWEEIPDDPEVPEIVRRNYLLVDTYIQSPPFTGLGIPGPDGDFCDVGPNGLPDLEEEDLRQMTSETREAFLQAQREELEWKEQWRSESIDGCRVKPKIGFTGVPV